MNMKWYRLTLRHDGGVVRITTLSVSVKRAVQMVCAAERAPLRAVVRVRRISAPKLRRK